MERRIAFTIAAASLGWGLAGVGVRAAFGQGASTMTVFATRTGFATIAVLLYAAITRTNVSATAWRHGTLIGVPRVGLAPLTFIASLQYISAGVEGLIITLVPATTAAMAAGMLGERLERRQLAGLATGLAGTAIIIVSGESGLAAGEGNALIGGALALAGVGFGSISGVLTRRYAPLHDTRSLTIPMFLSGTAVAALAGFATGDVQVSGLTAELWVLLVALGLGSTLLPFAATLYASRHTTAANVALTGYLAPLVGVVGGVMLLGEILTVPILIGGALTLVGVALVGGNRAAPVRKSTKIAAP
jgi:drug/metabolite transporter (DMT)-like permease